MLFAVAMLLVAQVAFSQNITLKFTGATNDGRFARLDSVQVQNVSRSWSETVVYPDTVLIFQQTGIADAQGSTAEIASYPNPFNGTTNVAVTMPQSGDATLQVYNLAGQRVAERIMSLQAGKNLFEVRLQTAQVYLLAVTTAEGRSTIKLLNRGTGSENSISYQGNSNIVEKHLSTHVFHSGDVLKIIGYTTNNGVVVTSREVLQPQTASENFTLFFTLSSAQTVPTVSTNAASGITSTSAITGGNVTNDGGAAVTARGVCWSTTANPTISGSHTTDGSGTGSFTSSLTGLTAGTTYYVRAYATNAAGTAYGAQITFTTSASLPTVTTTSASNVTGASATTGGNVTSDGGAAVIARGVCWSTTAYPTISDSHTIDSTGAGIFTSNITGLNPVTTYYVRAYATNAAGTAYGNQITFTTTIRVPTITTSSVNNITDTTAISGGNITSDGGAAVTARGVCWSTSQNPTISNSHTPDGSGMGSFTSSITGLSAATTYYVRAYATNAAGTAYGSQITFITTTAGSYTFSVSDTTSVVFSPSNLQWSAKNGGSTATTHTVAGGDTAAGTWRFAPHQWDTIGANNSNISSSYSGWIDLFGWGTSGYDNTANDPYAINFQPWASSTSTVNTTYNCYGYGPSTNMTPPNISRTNYDWGVYNAIYNPKTSTTDTAGTWRTLTKDEWVYLLNTRSTTSGIRYAKATVNGVPGLIIVPDYWSISTYALNSTNTTGAAYTTNVITSAQWTTLENAGCAFLPAAGGRNGASVSSVGSRGFYWSATYNSSLGAYYLPFYSDDVNPNNIHYRYSGRSVRLVRNVR